MLLKALAYSTIAMFLSIATFDPRVFTIFFTIWFIILYLNIFKTFGKKILKDPSYVFAFILGMICMIVMWMILLLN